MTHSSVTDQCQFNSACINSSFAFCPRCKSFLCMEHLELHHTTGKTQIKAIIHRIKINQQTTKAQLQMIAEQQNAINKLFELQRKKLTERFETSEKTYGQLSDEDGCFVFTNKYKEIVKDYEAIETETEAFSTNLIDSVSKIYQTQPLRLPKSSEPEQQLKSYRVRSPIILDMSVVDEIQGENIQQSDHESFDEITEVENKTNENSSKSNAATNSTSAKKKTASHLHLSKCPLTNHNVFGLTEMHRIPNVPCSFQRIPNFLSYGSCLEHLMKDHRFRRKAACILLDTLIERSIKESQFQSLDIFSEWKTSRILDQSATNFLHCCPLRSGKIFGLTFDKNSIHCNDSSKVLLYHHLRSVHDFQCSAARRFVKALIDDEPFTKEIFQPTENIFETQNLKDKGRKKRKR